MRDKKKTNDNQHHEVLKSFLTLESTTPNEKARTFFNLVYLKEPNDMILSLNPFEILSSEESLDVHQSCAILLSCNTQNIDTFARIPSFIHICEIFAKFSNMPIKYHVIYIQCLQCSILHYIDQKSIRAISKHIRELRKHGIISFHDEKCIEASMLAGNMASKSAQSKETKKQGTNTKTSLAYKNPQNTLLKNQLDSINKSIKILKANAWSKKLTFLCDRDLTKHVVVVGAIKAGKQTLISTMLYDYDNINNNEILDSIVPSSYVYGKEGVNIEYMKLSDLRSIQESTIKHMSDKAKELIENFKEDIKSLKTSIDYKDLKASYYGSNEKIKIVESMQILRKYNILKYVKITNTPSLMPITFRHLQVYRAILQSQIVLYVISADSISTSNVQADREAEVLTRIIEKPNVTKMYVVYTNMDKANLTLKRKQHCMNKIRTLISTKLSFDPSTKARILKKLTFHFVSSYVAYSIRSGKTSSFESGFDIGSSAIPDLEETLFNDIFESPITHNDIEILKNILRLCKNNYYNSTKEEHTGIKQLMKNITQSQYDEAMHNINALKALLQEAHKKLMAKYSSFYTSFKNLKDNLYSQFIQSLNYETRRSTGFNIKRLKTSTIESLVVGLQGLSEILQGYFLSLHETQKINTMLSHTRGSIFSKLCFTKEHVNILGVLSHEFISIADKGIVDNGNFIIATHLHNRIEAILPNNIKKSDIQEDNVIKPIKDSFDYYFHILERNIDTLFHERMEGLKAYAKRVQVILESIFLQYYQECISQDGIGYDIQECVDLLATLDSVSKDKK